MPAVLFLLHAIVLVLMWGLVLAAVVAVRSDFLGTRAAKSSARRQAAPAARPARTSAAARPAKPTKKKSSARTLAVTAGPLAGTTLPLTEAPVTIGRADSSTLVVADDYVSTHHARLVPQGDVWVVEDLGSTNGTYLDRAKVTEPTPVPIGVPIRIGKTTLELRK